MGAATSVCCRFRQPSCAALADSGCSAYTRARRSGSAVLCSWSDHRPAAAVLLTDQQAHRVIPVAALVLVLGICYGNLRDASDLRVAKRVQEGRHLRTSLHPVVL